MKPRTLLASLALALAPPAAAAEDAFEAAWRLVGETRFAEALERARAAGDALEGARARLLVLHHAGDLGGALNEGLDGLEHHARDPWLLDQTAYVALSLRRAELGAELARRLAAAASDPQLAPSEAQRYRERAAAHEVEATALLTGAREREAALLAARVTVGVLVAGALLLFAWLALAPGPRARSA